MWFQKKGESNQTYCRILLKDNLWFQIGKKEWDERKNELYDVVSWEFIKIEQWSYKPEEWEERELVKITLRDDEIWEIVISTAWTSVARNIVNSLAWCNELWMIEMWLYSKQGKNWKWYPNIWIKNNKERPDWFIPLEKQDEYIIKTEFQWKTLRDYTKLEDILKKQYENINKKSKYVSNEEKKEKKENTEDENSDLPF